MIKQLFRRLVPESCYSWVAAQTECRVPKKKKLQMSKCPQGRPSPFTPLYRVGPVYKLKSEKDIMFDIMTSGPVQGKYPREYRRVFLIPAINHIYSGCQCIIKECFQEWFYMENWTFMTRDKHWFRRGILTAKLWKHVPKKGWLILQELSRWNRAITSFDETYSTSFIMYLENLIEDQCPSSVKKEKKESCGKNE